MESSSCGGGSDTGGATGAGQAPLVISGGDDSTAVIAGWDTGAPLGDAIRALGEPTSLTPDRQSATDCDALWAEIKLSAEFYNLGGRDPCSPTGGALASALMRGPRWQTAAGLRVGDSVARLRQLYPNARDRPGESGDSINVRGWLLFPYYSRISASWASDVVAVVDDERVTAFRVDAYAGGE